MSGEKPPYICEPQDQSQGRPASFIFIHGYADDGEGLPLGLAQQFQFYNKAVYLRWVLPNAPIHPEARERAWYMPKALPNSLKPRVPGHDDDEAAQEPDDEAGILKSCKTVDELVKAELDRGVEPSRIIVGGFSQGCAISLIWGLTGEQRNNVGGIVCMSGYFPLADRLVALRKERGIVNADGKEDGDQKKWLYVHGNKDILVPTRLFEQGKAELKKYINEENLQERLYDGMGHSTCNPLLRDLLLWMGRVIPA